MENTFRIAGEQFIIGENVSFSMIKQINPNIEFVASEVAEEQIRYSTDVGDSIEHMDELLQVIPFYPSDGSKGFVHQVIFVCIGTFENIMHAKLALMEAELKVALSKVTDEHDDSSF